MIQQTTNYKIFKFRDDNRKAIDQSHVRKLAASIKMRNLLEMKPVIVNKDMEIIDGQHRVLAAEQAGVPIYYTVENKIEAKDLLLLNLAKGWRNDDYVNYYSKNGYVEYQKLEDFAKKNNLSITLALNLIRGRNKKGQEDLKNGEFKFTQSESSITELSQIKDIRTAIRDITGYRTFHDSTRFWKALLNIVKHPYYNHQKMLMNITALITKIGNRASYDGFLEMMLYVHNFRNANKIRINESQEDEE